MTSTVARRDMLQMVVGRIASPTLLCRWPKVEKFGYHPTAPAICAPPVPVPDFVLGHRFMCRARPFEIQTSSVSSSSTHEQSIHETCSTYAVGLNRRRPTVSTPRHAPSFITLCIIVILAPEMIRPHDSSELCYVMLRTDHLETEARSSYQFLVPQCLVSTFKLVCSDSTCESGNCTVCPVLRKLHQVVGKYLSFAERTVAHFDAR